MAVSLKREEKLLQLIPSRSDAVLLISEPVVRYYLGSDPNGMVIFATKDRAVTLLNFAAVKADGWQLLKKCITPDISTLEVEADALNCLDGKSMKSAIPQLKLDGALSGRIAVQRTKKEPEEIEFIRQAQEITDRAFMNMLPNLHTGMTDWDALKMITDELFDAGSRQKQFNHCVGTGSATYDMHVRPSGMVIREGDMVLFDIGATVEGYGSDMTRMVSFGTPCSEHQQIFDIVLEAQTAAISAISNSISSSGKLDCGEIDNAARNVIAGAGYGQYFTHGLGHPVGGGGNEGSRFSYGSKSNVFPETVMTVEPGIYLPGKFGVRLEDMVYVGAGFAEDITHTPRDLFVV